MRTWSIPVVFRNDGRTPRQLQQMYSLPQIDTGRIAKGNHRRLSYTHIGLFRWDDWSEQSPNPAGLVFNPGAVSETDSESRSAANSPIRMP